ncbi:glycosyl hydrolase family 18 protein [Paenibacillus soyae]|uniref:chitinase n=1 Tax=Paenibacillus soyae TaxID=2969249 RepID=A0A9X2MW58_9BACL|nr:glycosyl hydrolase family 18 protein [Paenibacillus soyae]MCR2807984.1 glycosyl hydrolase family 18 protein [Paenibacillus soyae]
MLLTRRKHPRLALLWLCFALACTGFSAAFAPSVSAADDKPPAPTNLRVISKTHNSVVIDWDNIPGVHPYDVGYWIVPGGWNSGDGEMTIGGLEPNKEYTISVGANVAGANVSTVKVTTDEAPPDAKPEPPLTAPQALKVTDISEEAIKLSWSRSGNATGYDIYLNSGWKAGTWNVDATEFTYELQTPPTAGEEMTFYVAAQKPPAVSKPSNAVKLVWGELPAPVDLQVVSSTRTRAALGWAAVPGATEYAVYQDGTQVATATENRYLATGLTEGESYTYHVVAKNALWESEASASLNVVPGAQYNHVTYYTAWSIYARDFQPEDIDASQITHINYAFADLCWDGFTTTGKACENDALPLQQDYVHDGVMVIGDPVADPANFAKFAEIKTANPHLNMMVSVGGWSWSKNFSNMAATELTRRAFAYSAVEYLREYGLDGLDIDWEYPVEGGETHNVHRPDDKQNFTLLMQTVREALDAAGSEDGKYYLLTIASGQGDNFVVNADFANSVQYLDFVNIMSYDYSGSWELLANHNSPLYYDKKLERSSAPRNNVRGGALGHLNGGVPPHKLMIGVPFYGKGWTGCPENGEYKTCTAYPAGTWERAIYDYTDVEENYLGQEGHTRYWNDASKVAYVYDSETGTFITYNDPVTMKYTSSLVQSLDVAGVMSWDISGDRNKSLTTELVSALPIDGDYNETALPAPQNATLASVQQTAAALKWDAVAGATGYEVYQDNGYVGYTTETQYTVNQLTASTPYTFYVLAVKKENANIADVSPSSAILRTTTPAWPVVQAPPPSGTPAKAPDELDTNVTKTQEGKWTVFVAKDAALKTIEAAKDIAEFKVTVGDDAELIDVVIPKEVVDALGAKGDMPMLSVIWNGVTYSIPVHAIHLGAEIQISIAPPSEEELEELEELAEADGLTLLADALDFKISKRAANGELEEIKDFGGYLLSRSFTVEAEDLDSSKATGVVYVPETGEFRPVPTLFTANKDGVVTAELLRDGNSVYTIVQSDIAYDDAAGHWSEDAVVRTAAKLLLAGETADTFGVDNSITRAEFTSMIVKGLGLLPITGESPFEDVAVDSEYAGDIAAAKEAGIIQGKSAATFDPNASISRQDMTIILSNVLAYLGVEAEADEAALEAFADAGDISAYAKSAVALVVEAEIMIGKSGSIFDPKADLTRAQAATIVIRILEGLGLDQV